MNKFWPLAMPTAKSTSQLLLWMLHRQSKKMRKRSNGGNTMIDKTMGVTAATAMGMATQLRMGISLQRSCLPHPPISILGPLGSSQAHGFVGFHCEKYGGKLRMKQQEQQRMGSRGWPSNYAQEFYCGGSVIHLGQFPHLAHWGAARPTGC